MSEDSPPNTPPPQRERPQQPQQDPLLTIPITLSVREALNSGSPELISKAVEVLYYHSMNLPTKILEDFNKIIEPLDEKISLFGTSMKGLISRVEELEENADEGV